MASNPYFQGQRPMNDLQHQISDRVNAFMDGVPAVFEMLANTKSKRVPT